MKQRSRYFSWLMLTLLGTGIMLSACGQKGPLTLQDKPASTQEEAKQHSQ